jgi:hypothetical protein
MPGARRTRSLACKIESTRVSHHRFAGLTRHSLRDGFNGFLRALPGDRALLPPSFTRIVPRDLTPASGRQDHTTSPSADSAVRQRTPPRPSHPDPTSVTIAKRPSDGCGMARVVRLIWVCGEAKYFRKRDWTGKSDLPAGQGQPPVLVGRIGSTSLDVMAGLDPSIFFARII